MTIIKVPYLDLKAQYRSIKGEVDAAISRVLDSCQFVLGPEVSDFEKAFGAYCGTSECIALNSGTSALHLALIAAGIGPGDEVITTPFTFVASVAAILYAGARPVLVDIEPQTLTLDSSKVEAAITPRTKAILPVHLYGHPADMDPIMELGRRCNLIVIEDAAQAHGARYKGVPVGGIGHMACFSFYPGKNLGAYGEGGAVTTNNSEYARTVRTLRDWGQDRKYHHLLRGYNYRMEGFQGAVLGAKLRHLEAWTEARRNLVQQYNHLLSDCELELPTELPGMRHVYHVYTIRSKERDRLQKVLGDDGIQTGIHYPVPVHLQPAYADLGYGPGSFPEAESAARQVLSLPLYPELSSQALTQVVDAVTKAVGGKLPTFSVHQ